MEIIQLPLYEEIAMLRRNDLKEIKKYLDKFEFDIYIHDIMIEIGNIEVIQYFLSKYRLKKSQAFINILNLNQEKSVIDLILIKSVRQDNANYVPYVVRKYMQEHLEASHDTFFDKGVDYDKVIRIMESFPEGKPTEADLLFPPFNCKRQERLSVAFEAGRN